jgi:hypothetical protein
MDKGLLPIRQQTLEFARDERWQLLPDSARAECLQALAQLLKQVIESERKRHEREDH